ncbi:haloacid dehalogenase [Pararhizobium polonicum]|uniref:(S)-2-haloacid dehalogenase n=1 Tax=Pararhizobium polonicum TaxID=1612624 RepID=A0A1C7P3Z8_9HYPH|nr:haloacid dehalogenase type II [Pararhizobium polonicum]OBZ95949.1 haloacid dehalogenase [Pararhizobium polonicum]
MSHAAYVFDAYGTLFDVHAAVRRHAPAMGADGQAFSDLWRAKQLEYSWIRTLMGTYTDFWTLTEQSLDYAFARFPSADRTLKTALLDAYWHLDCYPEVPGVLKHLKDRGARIAILSNGTPQMLQSAVKKAGLDLIIDDIFSVETVKSFKTAPAVYDMVTTTYRLYPDAVSFQSSNRWDIAGATKFGFRTVWINRGNMPDEYADYGPSLILPSLESL